MNGNLTINPPFNQVGEYAASSSIGKDTLDESPMAYKKASDILKTLDDTVEIEKRLLPVYNIKAPG